MRISTMLVAITCLAIALAGITGTWRLAGLSTRGDVEEIVRLLAVLSPFWIPVAAGMYAAGRRRLTAAMALSFALAEGAGLAVVAWLVS